MQDSKTSEKLPKKKKLVDFRHLVFVRLIDPIHIPKYLIEQIKEREYDVDRFYDYQKIICLQQGKFGMELNPSNFLYAIVNDELKQVKGFLWATLDYLTNSLIINNFSMDREYWNHGEAIELLEKQGKKLKKDLKLNKVIWITAHPKLCEKRGFKREKDVIMSYEGDDDGKSMEGKPSKADRSSDKLQPAADGSVQPLCADGPRGDIAAEL